MILGMRWWFGEKRHRSKFKYGVCWNIDGIQYTDSVMNIKENT